MKAAISASQFTSRYNQTIAASMATVMTILVNSPKINVIGVKASGLRALLAMRSANKPFGNTQHSPPSNDDISALPPPINPATAATHNVTVN